jgi:signal transduction histidine kinase
LGEVALNSRPGATDHREVISNVLEETDRLRGLCDSLLMLSRADSGQIELKPELVEIRSLVGDVLSLLSILAEERDQRIELEVPDGLSARVDPALFKQAVTNLLDNAIKYSPKNTLIRIRALHTAPGELAIQVIDQGPGILPEHQPLVFERFYRIDHSRSRLEGGAGLGLSIVRWVAELHEGRVTLTSQPGSGSTFEIAFKGGLS